MTASFTPDRGALAVPGTWDLDPACSRVAATIRHVLLARVRGHFPDVFGAVQVAACPEDSSVEATIETASVDTGDETRDERLRGPEFLDVARYPCMTFRSSSVSSSDSGSWGVHGDLTIRDRTRTITLTVTDDGVHLGSDGRTRARFLGSVTLAREEFGLTWNQALDTGGLVLGRTIAVELTIEAVLRSPDELPIT